MKFKYRSEIDGLRLLSIFSILFYNANLSLSGKSFFQGGFIGVDFFFVISGYLITSLILKELYLTNNFSFKNFYERRARRILPVLLFVMLVSMPFAWKYLLPSSFVDFAKSLLYSIGFTSNFYYSFNDQLSPFFHTWPLSILVQFYLFLPIFLFFIYKNFKNYFLTIIIIISFLSFFYFYKNFNINNLNIFSKLWLFLIGSILSYKTLKLQSAQINNLINSLLLIISIIIITLFVLFYNEDVGFKLFFNLLAITSFCYLMLYTEKNSFLTKILSSKFLINISVLSYSLYLWHYPIFTLSRITEFTDGQISKKIFLILLILLLSIFSYFFIEKIFRNIKIVSSKLFNIILICFITIIVLFSFVIIKNNGLENRYPKFLTKSFDSKPNFKSLSQLNKLCFGRISDFCNFNKNSLKKVILIGDTHMGSIMYQLKDQLLHKGYNFIPITKGGFIYLPNTETLNFFSREKNLDYEIINKKISELLKNNDDGIVVLGGMLSLYIYEKRFIKDDKVVRGKFGSIYVKKKEKSFNKDFLENEFKKLLNDLVNKYKVILIYPIPSPKIDVKKQLLKTFNLKNKLDTDKHLINTSFSDYLRINDDVFKLMDGIESPNLYKVYPHKLFCNKQIKNKCVTHDNKNIFFEKNGSLSPHGSQMINKLILRAIDNIEKN